MNRRAALRRLALPAGAVLPRLAPLGAALPALLRAGFIGAGQSILQQCAVLKIRQLDGDVLIVWILGSDLI